MPRPQEELLKHLERAVRALAEDPQGDHLGPLRYRPPQRFDRVRLSDRELLRIWRRDFFTCRYCGIRTIFTPVLRAISDIHPEDFPYDPNWRAQFTHPAYPLLSATCDHYVPITRGGDPLDEDNLVTACWPCNSGKSDYLADEVGFTRAPPRQSTWDGLTGIYPKLCDVSGVDERRIGDCPYHRNWLRALTASS